MEQHEIEPGLKSPQPFNLAPPPDPGSHEEWVKFLSAPVHDYDPGVLRQQLIQSPELAGELAESITANYRGFRKLNPESHAELAQLQMYYQPIVLELLSVPDLGSKARGDVFTLYPVIDSIHGQYELISSEPTIQLLKTKEVPAHMRKLALEKWFIRAELAEQPSEDDARRHSMINKWLVDFVATWSGEESADPDCIERIIKFLDGQADRHDDPIYVDPHSIGKIAKHLADEDLKYRFARRHINYEPVNNSEPPALSRGTDENDELLTWVAEKLHPKLNGFSFIALRRREPDPEDTRLDERLDEIWSTTPTKETPSAQNA